MSVVFAASLSGYLGTCAAREAGVVVVVAVGTANGREITGAATGGGIDAKAISAPFFRTTVLIDSTRGLIVVGTAADLAAVLILGEAVFAEKLAQDGVASATVTLIFAATFTLNCGARAFREACVVVVLSVATADGAENLRTRAPIGYAGLSDTDFTAVAVFIGSAGGVILAATISSDRDAGASRQTSVIVGVSVYATDKHDHLRTDAIHDVKASAIVTPLSIGAISICLAPTFADLHAFTIDTLSFASRCIGYLTRPVRAALILGFSTTADFASIFIAGKTIVAGQITQDVGALVLDRNTTHDVVRIATRADPTTASRTLRGGR